MRILPYIITIACMLILLIIYGFYMSSNDDSLLRSISSGAYTGTPDEHLIYIMIPLGLILKGLYSILPSAPWYDLLMCALHFLCWFLILIRVRNFFGPTKSGLRAIVITTLLLISVDLKFTVLHQYTTLAALLMATAVLYILTIRQKKVSHRIYSFVIITLLIMTLWLRKEVFLMGMVVVILSLFAFKPKEVFERKTAILVFLLIVLASIGIEAFSYATPEWKSFKRFNEARTEAYDYFKFPEYEKYSQEYEKRGISEAEYEVLAYFLDVSFAENTDTDKLNELCDKYDEIIKDWQQYYSVPKKLLKDTAIEVFRDSSKPLTYILAGAVLLSIWLLIRSRKKEAVLPLILIALAYGYRLSFTAYFIYRGRFPQRVSHGLLMIILSFVLGILLSNYRENVRAKKMKFAGYVTVFLLVACSFANIVSTNKDIKPVKEGVKYLQAIYDYCGENPDKTYLINTYSIAPLGDEMLAAYKKLPQNALVMGNWTAKSPLEMCRFANRNVALADRALLEEGYYLIMDNALDETTYSRYYEENGVKVKSSIVDSINANDKSIKVVEFKP